MDLQQLVIFFKQVLRQAQHERNINVLREFPFGLSLSKGSCCEFIKTGFPIRRASGMTLLVSSGKLAIIRKEKRRE
jgi:hypothetical protein